MNLYDVLSLKYPEADMINQIQIGDKLGNGELEIVLWDLPGTPLPTLAEIASFFNDTEIQAKYTAKLNAELNAPILVQLSEIDAKSIRALRTNDAERLAELEEEAIALRAQLH